ncbi:hypothetical protein ACFWBI_22845 [Streptomyces sp. NPDC059982]|uniref:hypothetical protein n=1 Tax=unclassified Streptomyces TaxID=2593676 RepID=UPI00367FFDA3
MTTPTSTRPPALACAPSQIGPCAKCRQPCCRYGVGANSLCVPCRTALQQAQQKPHSGA